jgi:hypothetical protein
MFIHDKKVRIWKKAVEGYFNMLFQHSFGNGGNPRKAQTEKSDPEKIAIGLSPEQIVNPPVALRYS